MSRQFGLTPDILADGASDILEPQKEKPVQVADLPPSIRNRITDTPTTPTAPPARDPAELVREQKQKERERIELETKLKKEQGAASAARQAQIYKQYEGQLNEPAPKFEAPKETFTQLAGLGAMMMMLGAMAGGKTYGSAIGAMNGLAGMFKGYQEGRKETYDRSKVEFEQSLKAWKENKAQVKEAFQRALKLGAKDINKATSDVVAELAAKGETTAAELVTKRGLASAAQAFNVASDNADKSVDLMRAQIDRIAGVNSSTMGGVELAGDAPTGGRLTTTQTTKQRIEELRREEEDAAIELEALKARKTYASPSATAGGQDPQWVKAEGELFRATKDEREQMRRANIPFEYATGPTTPREEKKEWVTLNGQLKKMSDKEIADALAKGETVAPRERSAPAETRYSFNVAEAYGQAVADLVNITKLPKDTLLGTFAGMTGKSGDSLTSSLKNTFARSITPTDQRQFQQLISGFENNMSRALGGGYASSGARYAIEQYKDQVAREGDNIEAKALFLARAKQELNILAKYYYKRPGAGPFVEEVKRDAEALQKAIPFSVDDVLRAESGAGGSRELSPQDQSALDWANGNPNDPRSQKIKQRLGVQ